MKRAIIIVLTVALFGEQPAAGERKRRDACEKIPEKALTQADDALKQTYPVWEAIPELGDGGVWRCKTNGSFVRRYDKTLLGERVPTGVLLLVEKKGSIFVCDQTGCFSIDRWK